VKRICATGDVGYIADGSLMTRIWRVEPGPPLLLHQRISAPISKSSLYEPAMKASNGRKVSRARDA
jgi:hypothetical protein